MKTFEQIIQGIYGTEDELHYICPRLSDNDLLHAVHEYTRQCCKDVLERAYENIETQIEYDVHWPYVVVDKESITETEIILP